MKALQQQLRATTVKDKNLNAHAPPYVPTFEEFEAEHGAINKYRPAAGPRNPANRRKSREERLAKIHVKQFQKEQYISKFADQYVPETQAKLEHQFMIAMNPFLKTRAEAVTNLTLIQKGGRRDNVLCIYCGQPSNGGDKHKCSEQGLRVWQNKLQNGGLAGINEVLAKRDKKIYLVAAEENLDNFYRCSSPPDPVKEQILREYEERAAERRGKLKKRREKRGLKHLQRASKALVESLSPEVRANMFKRPVRTQVRIRDPMKSSESTPKHSDLSDDAEPPNNEFSGTSNFSELSIPLKSLHSSDRPTFQLPIRSTHGFVSGGTMQPTLASQSPHGLLQIGDAEISHGDSMSTVSDEDEDGGVKI